MKTMKRAVVLFLMVSLTALAACGSDDDDDKTLSGGPGGGPGTGGTGGLGTGGGTGGGSTGGGGGSSSEEGLAQYENVRLQDLTDQQSITVCREAFGPYTEQLNPNLPAGKGACLWNSVNYAAQNFDKDVPSTLIPLCESSNNSCLAQSPAEYTLNVDNCLPLSDRSHCSATVAEFHSCVYTRHMMKNTNFKSTANETCDAVFSSTDTIEAYVDKVSDEYSVFCMILQEKCPEFFEAD